MMRGMVRFIASGIGIALLLSLLPGQEEVVERVEVVNREVLVRVFDGGEPVPGLTRKDFTVTENGNPVTITSCRMERRALAPTETPAAESGETVARQRPRLFLFLLWWNEESRDWPKAWDYFLKHIFRPGDRVILAAERQVIQIYSPAEEKREIEDFFAKISGDLKRKHMEKIRLARELERCTKAFFEDLFQSNVEQRVLLEIFKACYRGALDEYRLQRLRAHPVMLERLAAALRTVYTEKWALVFLQNECLPLLYRNSRLFSDAPLNAGSGEKSGEQAEPTAKKLKRFLDACDRSIRNATDMAVFVRDLRSLFIGAGATFHLFLSDASDETHDSDFLRWFPVFSSWESAFRGIARDTGGDVQNTLKLKRALERAAARPDVYYVLTYKPQAPGLGKPKIRIRVSRPGLKVVYARKLSPREIRPLKLSEPVWKKGVLRFSISDFLRETGVDGAVAGDVHIQVRSETPAGDPLVFEKILHPGEDAAAVEMRVNFPEPGEYILTVAARDRLSGNTARGYTRAAIAPPQPEIEGPMDPKLRALLDRAAVYCERLQKAAFRFTCTEVVEERYLERNAVRKRVETETNQWRYDYQVVADKGEVQEQRRLIKRGIKKADVPDARLETRFKALYSVFLPVTLLGEHNRGNYRYKLLETERLKKRPCAVIEVVPRKAWKGPLARGRAWVDVDNGSVLKIEMDPRGVAGSAALEAAARKMSARLELKVVHWYLEARKGLRFPSSAEFSESYVFDREARQGQMIPVRGRPTGHPIGGLAVNFRFRMVEFYRMSQTYKKYRYFEVDTRVKEVESDDTGRAKNFE